MVANIIITWIVGAVVSALLLGLLEEGNVEGSLIKPKPFWRHFKGEILAWPITIGALLYGICLGIQDQFNNNDEED